jgi:hypothetical protein
MSLNKKFNDLKKCIEKINLSTKKLLGDGYLFFDNMHIDLKLVRGDELSFLKLTSWLYKLYFEAGHNNIKFLENKFHTYGINLGEHKKDVHALRTYFQHVLDENSNSDLDLLNYVENLFIENIGRKMPSSDNDWSLCVELLVVGSLNYLEKIHECLDEISNDEFKDVIINDWQMKIEGGIKIYAVIPLCKKITEEIGYEFIDAKEFTRKNYDKWVKEASFLKGDNNEEKLRPIIQRDLLKNDYSPLNGIDIIEHFKIDPGPRVGELLSLSKKIFSNDPSSKEILLKKLKAYVDED